METRNLFQRFIRDGFYSALVCGLIYFCVHQPRYSFVTGIAILVALILVGNIYAKYKRTEMANGRFAKRFVHVENDGTVRTLTPEELIYLNTEFHPADGARPYFKSGYSKLTPDGKMHGFLLRRKLPKEIVVINS